MPDVSQAVYQPAVGIRSGASTQKDSHHPGTDSSGCGLCWIYGPLKTERFVSQSASTYTHAAQEKHCGLTESII